MDFHDRVASLPALLQDIQEARVDLDEQRAVRGAHQGILDARANLVVALERYAEALAATGRPVPYKLRDELLLYKELRRSH